MGVVGTAPEDRALRGGRHVGLRPIAPSDAPALVRFHESLSDRSRRYRFFSPHPHLSAEELEKFTHVDNRRRQAFVALSGGEIVGVGRYDGASATTGEVAFVVRDDWQGIGVGSLLLRRLAAWARDHDVTTFEADVLGDNAAMLRVFGRWCPQREMRFDHGVARLVMPIPGSQSSQRHDHHGTA